MVPYVGLHNHTDASNLRMLDCCNKLNDLVNKAIEIGLSGIAITDHESLSNHIKAIKLQKKLQEQDIDFKIILGDECYLIDSLEEVRDNYQSKITKFFHFIIIAKDSIGYKQLRKISTVAWQNSFYTGKMERTPITKKQLEDIIGEEKGHLIFSTACIGGEAAWWILQDRPDKFREFVEWCQQVALPENFYFEMQPNDSPEQVKVNQMLVHMGEKLSIKRIITTDVHYLTKDHAKIHEAFLNSREDESRETLEFYRSCYLMDSDEIHEWMDKQIGADEIDKALQNTIEIADKIEFFDLAHNQVVFKPPIPEFELQNIFKEYYEQYSYLDKFSQSEEEYDRYFLHLVEQGWLKKENSTDLTADTKTAMVSRINDELRAIWETSIKIEDCVSAYYLGALYLEDIMWNDANSLVGDARGSVAAFYVCYLIGLQQINSFRFDIPYWRHLHESRPEMPDVDIDSEKSRRSAIIEAVRTRFGEDRVLNIAAFKTEAAKSAIQTAGRGLNISPEATQYLGSLIPVVRGKITSLHTMVYGDNENDIKPNTEFINECNKYPHLLETAMAIEGLVSGRTVHASGIIIFDRPYTELNCMMRSPNKLPITQWDMDDSTYCGGLKYDFLTIVNLDAIHQCMKLLCEYGYIEDQGSLKATYDKYFSPDVIDYNDKHMWEMAEKHEIINLFQFMTPVGQAAIAKVKPRSLTELGTANAIMRLQGQPDQETPIDRFVRFKNNIEEWYDLMRSYHLTDEEINIMEDHLKSVFGSPSMQEEIMKLSMDSRIVGYDMKKANSLRKLIAKKKVELQTQARDEFYETGKEKGTSKNLLDYIWKECVTPQLNYSFSLPHILGYSTIAIQEMNQAAKYPIIFWNCANLIVDSMADESLEGSTDYGAVGIAISSMQKQGIKVEPPNINTSKLGFVPDVKTNSIIYGLGSLCGIGDEACAQIITNRPYNNFSDFCHKMIETKIIKPTQMMQLIKGGAFDEFDPSRTKVMEEYLRFYVFEECKTLTLSQLRRVEELGMIPKDVEICVRYLKYRDYVLDEEGWVEDLVIPDKKVPKCGYHDRLFILDSNSQSFFTEHFSEDSVVRVEGEYYVISEKKFSKEIDAKIQPLRNWLSEEETLDDYNDRLFKKLWYEKCKGTEAAWAMQSLSYYDKEHELDGVDLSSYGVVNYFKLPSTPEAYEHYDIYVAGEKKTLPKYKIVRIAGTVLDSNNISHTVVLLTTNGTVNVKFNQGQYTFYNKRISAPDVNGETKILENSWFKRGTLLIVAGFRREDNFVPKVYKDSVWGHTVNKIVSINPNKQKDPIDLQLERTKV